jgi:hypothetical protein
MKKAILFRIVFVLVALIALSSLPQPVLAQRGGHGGGGGFHGGGGGGFHGGGGGAFRGGGGFYGGGRSGYAGARSFGGYHGGGYYGGRAAYGWGGRGYGWGGRGYGWGGGYWGHGYGWGWGFGFGFGFGWPYWGWGYPYGYGYSPWYYAPDPYYYSYPYYGPSGYPAGYPDPDNGNDKPSTADPNARPQANQNGPARSWRPPGPGGAANTNYTNSNVATAGPRGPVPSLDTTSVTPISYRAARSIPERSTTGRSTSQSDAPLRPEMQKALQRLREMPPFAREREIETGRYRQFSPEEKQILRNGK